jgi:hypothetical protein
MATSVAATTGHTPDRRYIIVRGRLWRASHPNLPEPIRQSLVNSLMKARRAVRLFKDKPRKLAKARALVQRAKALLGERGPVWWDDGEPDYNRRLVKNTPYGSITD